MLWENASIEFEGPELVLDFAAERPAALPLIRVIILNVALNGFPALDTRTEDLERMLNLVSTRCEVRFFVVKLWTNYRALLGAPREAVGGRLHNPATAKLSEWTPLFRSLRTSGFILRPLVSYDFKEVNEDWDREAIEIFSRTRREWTPDCMREETVQAAYLRERTQWVEEEEREEEGKLSLTFEPDRVRLGPVTSASNGPNDVDSNLD